MIDIDPKSRAKLLFNGWKEMINSLGLFEGQKTVLPQKKTIKLLLSAYCQGMSAERDRAIRIVTPYTENMLLVNAIMNQNDLEIGFNDKQYWERVNDEIEKL